MTSQLLKAADELSIDSNIEFCIKNNVDKPLLRLKSTLEKLYKYSIIIHLIPEVGTFKEPRFNPTLNNVRHGWFFETVTDSMFQVHYSALHFLIFISIIYYYIFF